MDLIMENEHGISNKNQELKRKRFLDLGERRMNNAIKSLKSVQNLGNKHNYIWEKSEAKLIITTLQKSVNDIKSAFEEGSGVDEEFRFTRENEE